MNHIRATVGAIVLNESGDKLLLARRAHTPFEGMWCIPGGHIEFGEHPDDAVRREVFEETGISLTSCRFIRFYSEYYEFMQWHAVALIYAGTGTGALVPQPGEVSELAFVTVEEAMSRELAFNHRDIIQDFAGQTE